MPFKILLVEDDSLFQETIEELLQEEGYLVESVPDIKGALEYIYYTPYDLYILDVKLPDGSGFELLDQRRRQGDTTPTLFLTSKREGLKEGFLRGGDDYLVKPVDLEELLLRIRAILRRSHGGEVVTIGPYTFNITSLQLLLGERPIDLGLKELKLLELFVKNRGKNLSKEEIFEHLWKPGEFPSDGALRVYITTLKRLFGKDAITNIRGYGYRFEK
ncbi:MAG: response regulator transcription factor [Epsilonproteobacteria bacterium]|nr:response regulator transcription factor [Campylobacterota bacterium]